MPFPASYSRRTAFHLGAVLPFLFAVTGAAHGQGGPACDTREHCIAAILDAGRAGDEMQQLALMGELAGRYGPAQPNPLSLRRPLALRPDETLALGDPGERMIQLVRYIGSNDTPMPEQVRAQALAYLVAQRPDDAERELADGLVSQPVHAPYWLDLAQVYLRQGHSDKAVAALVTAEAWAYDPKAMRGVFRRMTEDGATPAIRNLHAQALQIIDARLAARTRQDAAVPPPPASGKLPEGSPTPTFLPGTCRVKPAYPRGSLRYEESGTVTWAFLVGADGRMLAVRKLKSSGFPDLDMAALLPLSSCRAEPAMVDGKPAPAWRSIEYVWTLD